MLRLGEPIRTIENGSSVNYYSLRLPLRLDSYFPVFKHNIKVLEETIGGNNPELINFLAALHLLDDLANLKQFNPEYDQVKHAKGMLWDVFIQCIQPSKKGLQSIIIILKK